MRKDERHTAGKWGFTEDANENITIWSHADSHVMRAYRADHPECTHFRGTDICRLHTFYNGGGPDFGPHKIVDLSEVRANAYLFVAAPELLSALSTSVRMVDAILNDLSAIKGWKQYVERVKKENDNYRAVIAKATGEAE